MKAQELEKPLEWSELGLPPVETTAQEAKRVLLPIPEEKWCTGIRTDFEGRSCALGHYSRRFYGHDGNGVGDAEKTRQLIMLSNEFLKHDWYSIAGVNNGELPEYNQPSPKQRTIAFLDDMIKAGF